MVQDPFCPQKSLSTWTQCKLTGTVTVTLQFNVVKNRSWQLWSAGLSVRFCLQMDRWVSESVCMWKVKRWTKWMNTEFRSISLNRCSVGVKLRKDLQGQLPRTTQNYYTNKYSKRPVAGQNNCEMFVSHQKVMPIKTGSAWYRSHSNTRNSEMRKSILHSTRSQLHSYLVMQPERSK